jgi:hypothetical protein
MKFKDFTIFEGYKGFGDLFDGLQGEDEPARWDQAPEYPEAKGARQLWWKTLQGYNPENMYGAISPDWADIFDRTQKKIHQTYWGSPTSSGVAGKIKSSAARRGVSESPALDKMLGRIGVSEAGDISDALSNLNFQQSQFGETARGNWLNQLASLSGRTPSAQYIPEKEGTNWLAEILGIGAKTAVTAGLSSMFPSGTDKLLQKLLDQPQYSNYMLS